MYSAIDIVEANQQRITTNSCMRPVWYSACQTVTVLPSDFRFDFFPEIQVTI